MFFRNLMSLAVFGCGIVSILLAMWASSLNTDNGYIVTMYLAYTGLCFVIMGIIMVLVDLTIVPHQSTTPRSRGETYTSATSSRGRGR